jgi:hypothetical protein
MSRFARILAFVFLAAFATGTAADASVAAGMSLKMTMAGMDHGNLPDCQDCSGDKGQVPECGQACATALAVLCLSESAAIPVDADSVTVSGDDLRAGRTGPPEHHPPRTVRLA